MKKIATIMMFLAGAALANAQTVAGEANADVTITTQPPVRQLVKAKMMPGASSTKPTLSAETAAQVKALHQEMNAKIKAIHEEYRAKFKALGVEVPAVMIGAAGGAVAQPVRPTTTMQEGKKPQPLGARLRLKAEGEVKGASEMNVMQLIRGLFGQQDPAAQ